VAIEQNSTVVLTAEDTFLVALSLCQRNQYPVTDLLRFYSTTLNKRYLFII